MIMLDTHIWVRWQNAPDALPQNVLNWIENSNNLVVSAISCWEVAMLVRKQLIKLAMPIAEWIDEALASMNSCLSVDRNIMLLAAQLPDHHRDPADRMIIATAIHYQTRLISFDEMFSAYTELDGLLLPSKTRP